MISDERLREAARKVEESMLASLPEPEECEATFSPEFERKMEKLLHRADHPIGNRIMKAVACFLLAVLVGGGSVLTFSVEARAAFVTWVKEVYETQFIYRFFQTNEGTPDDTVYRPTWIPSDYHITIESLSEDPSTIIYQNSSGKLASFTYFHNTSSPVFNIERDGTETYSRVYVNGIPAELYLDQDEGESNILIWIDENTGAGFCIIASFSDVELIKMAESVEKYES